jgi:hypothetical protein
MNLKFKHSGASGDILYAMPAIKKACDTYDLQAVLYININAPNVGSNPAFKHAYGDVMLNDYAYKMLRPLLMEFDFIYDVLPYRNQRLDYDLDKFRSIGMNLAAYDIKRWYALAFPELTNVNYSEPTLHLERSPYDYIVVNRTERYQNPNIDYRVLNDYKGTIYFTGSSPEYTEFSKLVNCKYLSVDNFSYLARVINNSKLFIGNQSMNFAIAESLKCRRALEICYYAPNVIPAGGEYYELWNTESLNKTIKLI